METISKARLKLLRSLAQRKGREEQSLYIAEGPYLLDEALKTQVMPRFVVVSEKQEGPREKVLALVERCTKENIECVSAGEAEFAECADTVNSQGVLAVFAIPQYELATLLERHDLTLLVLDNIREPGNLGAICRHAAAFDCGGLLLLKGCVDAWNNKAVRASMGAIFTQRLVQAEWDEFLPWLRSGRGELVATWLGDDTKDYQAVRYAAPTFILIGNESQGLPQAYAEAADVRVKMPMMGKADSLNAAVAAAVMAYEVLNQQRS